MAQVNLGNALESGRDAVRRHAWREAFDQLTAADQAESLNADDLEGLAEAAWWSGRADACISARERAYALQIEAGLPRRAALIALALAKGQFEQQAPAVGTAWLSRAQRLLRDEPIGIEHGYLARLQTVIALEADGTVKGCPSLPTIGYAGGNIRTLSLEDIWRTSPAIHFGRLRTIDDLWGFCRGCYYADVCRGGCTWTTHSLLGRPGNNPYCHYRVTQLARQGFRERIVKKEDAAPSPFAVGKFELILEPVPGAVSEPARSEAPAPPAPAPQAGNQGQGRIPPKLTLCHSCYQFVWPSEIACPFCGTDIEESAAAGDREHARLEALIADVEMLTRGQALPTRREPPPRLELPLIKRPPSDGPGDMEVLVEAVPRGMPSSPPASPEPNAAPVPMPHSGGATRV